MNTDFLQVINAKPEDRRGLFLATANRLGTTLAFYSKEAPLYLQVIRLFHVFQKTSTSPFFDKILG